MIPGAAALRIRIGVAGGEARAAISAPDPLPFGRLVAGKPVEEAAKLAPLLFNICAAAQGCAARGALGLPQLHGAPDKVRAETLREHGLKLFVALPRILGTGEDPAGVAALQAGGRAGLDALYGPGAEAPQDLGALHAWARRGGTAPARALAALLDWPQDWAGATLPLLCIVRELDWDVPGQERQAAENSALSRMLPDPRMQDALLDRGICPSLRMIARVLEAEALLAPRARWPLVKVAGHAAAHAARGAMLMRAEVKDGVVIRAERMTPTDFALAPGGSLRLALDRLPAGAGAPTETVARAAVALIDPCMPVSLEMTDA